MKNGLSKLGGGIFGAVKDKILGHFVGRGGSQQNDILTEWYLLQRGKLTQKNWMVLRVIPSNLTYSKQDANKKQEIVSGKTFYDCDEKLAFSKAEKNTTKECLICGSKCRTSCFLERCCWRFFFFFFFFFYCGGVNSKKWRMKKPLIPWWNDCCSYKYHHSGAPRAIWLKRLEVKLCSKYGLKLTNSSWANYWNPFSQSCWSWWHPILIHAWMHYRKINFQTTTNSKRIRTIIYFR